MGWFKKEKELVWNHKNLILLLLSVMIAIFILKSEFIKNFINGLGEQGYLGAFFSGLFFSYGITTAPAVAMLYLLGNNLNPFYMAAIGAVGAFLSDYLIFRFVKYGLANEIKRLSDEIKFHPHLKKPYIKILKKLAPLIAGFIIASPLPDELAAYILGSIKVKDIEFIFISLISNFIGILVIALL